MAETVYLYHYSRLKYAACVPHVMLYPANGCVAVEETRMVTVK